MSIFQSYFRNLKSRVFDTKNINNKIAILSTFKYNDNIPEESCLLQRGYTCLITYTDSNLKINHEVCTIIDYKYSELENKFMNKKSLQFLVKDKDLHEKVIIFDNIYNIKLIDSSKITEPTDWSKLDCGWNTSSNEGSSPQDSEKYIDTVGSNVSVGGIPIGYKTNEDGVSAVKVLYDILHQYQTPIIKLLLDPADGVYVIGNMISSVTLTANVEKRSNDIISVEFFKGATLLHSITSNVSNGGTFTFNYEGKITEDETFKVVVNDGTSTVFDQKTYKFINNSFYGSLSKIPTEFLDISVLTPIQLLSKESTLYFNVADEYMIYAYPEKYGNLNAIKDKAFGFTISMWDLKKISTTDALGNDVVYNVYINPTKNTVTNFGLEFN